MESALQRHYPELPSRVRPPLNFPPGLRRPGRQSLLTVATTRNALKENRRAAVERLEKRLGDLIHLISLSGNEVKFPAEFTERLALQLEACGQGEIIRQRNPQEPFRQFFSALRIRLKELPGATPFHNVAEFIAELAASEHALVHEGVTIAATWCAPAVGSGNIGFRTVILDIRQNTTVINLVLQEIWHKMNPVAKKPAPKEGSADWTAWILEELNKPLGFLPNFFGVSEETRELLDLLYLIRESLDGPDPQSIGTFILSMTRSSADVLGLYLLAKYCGLFRDDTSSESCRLRIVPLFETIDDLRAGPAIMKELLATDVVKKSVADNGGRQEIMLGYSDSNKDGGFFCASFELFEAQRRLIRVGKQAGVDISFFHGRGGSVSRGGAPTGRAIAAQPAGTISGHMRVTEQGEVVSSKFANRGTALNNLDGSLKHSGSHLEIW